ncbi:MAG: peptide-methionine (S)-S-oxide reductase MsrA [Acidimicrobiales bacterium]
MVVADRHLVLGTPLMPPFPGGMERAMFAMGCFWGAERIFWSAEGVYTTAVGYTGGLTPNPTYEEVCSGRTGHAETVLCVFDPSRTTYGHMLRLFLEGHDPTQGMRQGNDIGTQYRSAVFTTSEAQLREVTDAARRYDEALAASGHRAMTTELVPAGPFYYAEGYHQQYLAANPDGYCGLGGTGVSCPIGIGIEQGSGGGHLART